MHEAAYKFLSYVQNISSEYFKNIEYLDVGAGDINGNLNSLFESCIKNANDVAPNENVTIISKTKDLPFEDNKFDTVISSECFEHDPTYKESFIKIYKMLKPGGLFAFTCASIGREEHGTIRTNKGSSLGALHNIDNMGDYYKNLEIQDLNEVLDLNKLFSNWNSYYNKLSKDLYFIGFKKNNDKIYTIKKKYQDNDTIKKNNNI